MGFQRYGIGTVYDIRRDGAPDRILILSAIAVVSGIDKGKIKYTGLLESQLGNGLSIVSVEQEALGYMMSKKYNADHAPVYDNFTYIARNAEGWRWVSNAVKMETLHRRADKFRGLDNVKHIRITEAYDRDGHLTDGGALWIMYNNQLDETFKLDAQLVANATESKYPIDIK